MKRIFTFLLSISATISLFAQDIIVTNDAKKIEAKILEVSKTEIKYKEADNLEGPTFVLGVEDINSIIYSNGKVALYNQETPKDVQAEKDAAEEKARREEQARIEAERQTQEQARLEAERKAQEQALERQRTQEQLDRLQEQARESGKQVGAAIRNLIEVNNSYALDVTNTTKHPYKINLDGHILGTVNPYKTQRFIVPVERYGRMQAVQTSGYIFSPTIKEYKIPRQQKQTSCTVVIK